MFTIIASILVGSILGMILVGSILIQELDDREVALEAQKKLLKDSENVLKMEKTHRIRNLTNILNFKTSRTCKAYCEMELKYARKD